MLVIWGSIAGMLLYLEIVYHISCFGLSRCNPMYTLFLIAAWSAGVTVVTGIFRGKWKKLICGFFLWFAVIWTAVQVVYLRIFKQPLLWEAAFRGGGDALTNYWRETLDGIFGALPILFLLVFPAIVISILLHRKKWVFPQLPFRYMLRTVAVGVIGIVGCAVTLQIGKFAEQNYYEDYYEFFDPLTVAETMGVWPMLERDTMMGLQQLLAAPADNDGQEWLAEYMNGTEPVGINEYTGIFEGYNLIYLTAEGFSTHAISEELTPTLYRLTHSGFVFENYYVPLWQTSTSDGEYVNCTGLIPDGQFSMQKSAENDMPYTLPRYFSGDGVKSYAYHNGSLSYYDRYLTHSNLGYDFKGCKLGNLPEEEWGGQIFPMENPEAWPASDLEMMQGTVPEYIDEERFHVYYLTISGHLNYNFSSNAMSVKNRAAVDSLEMSEAAKAYIACNMELDKALEYLLAQLEAAGRLENTVICLSADHYPYGLETEQYEELAGRSLAEGKDLYRNSLILWNVGMEESVVIDKACCSVDVLPTLLNLFGYSYDSRMYAGRDILSDTEGMVIFNDRSFVTDGVIYDRKENNAIWLKDENGKDIVPDEARDAYLAEKKQEVKSRYQFSAYVLQEDYYGGVETAESTE